MIALIVIPCVVFYVVAGIAVGVARYQWAKKHYSYLPMDFEICAFFEGVIWPITLLIALGWKIGMWIGRKF